MSLTNTPSARLSRAIPSARACSTALLLAFLATSSPAAESPDSGRLLLWEIKSPTATAYVIGSLHVTDASIYPLDSAVTDAFNKADTLVLEMDMNPDTVTKARNLMMQSGLYPAGETLEGSLSKDAYAKLTAYLSERGMKPAMFSQMRPWFVTTMLTALELQRLGFSPDSGLDMSFLKLAAAKGTRVIGLETPEEQVETMSGALSTVQEKELVDFVTEEAGDKMKAICEELIDAWRSGDPDRVQTVIDREFSDDPALKDYQAKLLDDRSVRMAERLRGILKGQGTYFVCVGSGHVVGRNGIPTLLDHDFEVTQLEKAGAPEKPQPAAN